MARTRQFGRKGRRFSGSPMSGTSANEKSRPPLPEPFRACPRHRAGLLHLPGGGEMWYNFIARPRWSSPLKGGRPFFNGLPFSPAAPRDLSVVACGGVAILAQVAGNNSLFVKLFFGRGIMASLLNSKGAFPVFPKPAIYCRSGEDKPKIPFLVFVPVRAAICWTPVRFAKKTTSAKYFRRGGCFQWLLCYNAGQEFSYGR